MIIKVRVIPDAKKTEIISRVGTVLRVRLATSGIEEKANKMLISFLSEFFEVPKFKIYLRKGVRAKEKTIEIEGKPDEKLREMLEAIP